MAERRVPRIRFKGFEEDWEQRKLGELADIVGGGTPSTSNLQYWDGDIDWYAPAEINEQVYVSSSQKKITKAGYENSSVKLLPVGTVLFTSRAGIGKTAILAREACTNQGFQSIVPHKQELDSYFIFSRAAELKRYGEIVGAGSTFVEISGKQMAEMELMMPYALGEQQAIGTYFRRLDWLISLHQRKLEKLKILKKAMLEKMFPKNGAKVPEIRFSGFTDDWEQRKLGEMAVISTGYPFNSNEFSPEGKYLVITNGNIQDSFTNVDESVGNRITLLDRKILDSYILDIGDILITMDGTVGRTAKVAGNGLILAQRVGRVKPIGNTEFMYQALSTGDFSKAMTELSHGGTIKHISLNEISLFEFKSPVREREQNTVGKFLYLFDTLLSLHQRKLEKLRQIKKSMLERMFV